MKKQALTLAIAAALSAPSALAAQDTSGMHYTSASEGFYASIRVRYDSGTTKKSKGGFEDSSSRIGVQGTNDLGGGLEGFYRYEWEVDTNDTDRNNGDGGDNGRTRLGLVGLRGSFGQVQMGTFWTQDYNWTHGSTDVANKASGWFNYSANRPGRQKQAIEYTTPNLNGFQGAVRVNAADGGATDKNNIDVWNLAGTYTVQGFTVGGAYNVVQDGLNPSKVQDGLNDVIGVARGYATHTNPYVSGAKTGTDDVKSWTVRLGYAQDNWYVNGWYGVDNTSDLGTFTVDPTPATAGNDVFTVKADDTTIFSLAGGVTLDKVGLYALYEKRTDGLHHDGDDAEDVRSTIGAQYNLGSKTWVWVEYAMRDDDSDAYVENAAGNAFIANTNRAENSVNIGLGHSF